MYSRLLSIRKPTLSYINKVEYTDFNRIYVYGWKIHFCRVRTSTTPSDHFTTLPYFSRIREMISPLTYIIDGCLISVD
jgi:hypothetical protein